MVTPVLISKLLNRFNDKLCIGVEAWFDPYAKLSLLSLVVYPLL